MKIKINANETETAVFQTALSFELPPEHEKLGIWLTLAGHWKTSQHHLRKRTINEIVMIYCVNGEGEFTLAGRKQKIEAGDIFLCPENIEHGYGCHKKTGWEIYWIHFCGQHGRSLSEAAGFTADNPIIRNCNSVEVKNHFETLIQIGDSKNPAKAIDGAGVLQQILFDLIKHKNYAKRDTNLTALFSDQCESLDELAEKAGYSKYHFSRLFKEETGQSPWQYLTERKVGRARELLTNTDLSIKEIAAILKYDNPDYFAKVFAKHTGLNPMIYRGRKSK
ncbi:MAG: AraC family transcriptional regulator, partial [Planctomycetota bacterium]|jgi:AraC-like DNA-binding protein